ncbi:hypothetical protein [Desulfurococcus amylolyticus]|uniref:hypothetical protein n=1 Tax=Desulfurococcus amylolyticus TaxID=94694 RepID=UPI00022DFE59|nr:hypothetical protein [Desulfurococcus amylolyticus]
MRVSPEPAVPGLLERYRDALNYSIRVIVENNATSISKAHSLLYETLKRSFDLPSKIAQDYYREAISIAKSRLGNPGKGKNTES